MRFVPHLIFDGQCETAFRFYERTLDGNLVTLLNYGGSAMAEQLPREWREKIVHANLTVDDTELVGADAFPGQYQRPQGFYVLLELSAPERTEPLACLLTSLEYPGRSTASTRPSATPHLSHDPRLQNSGPFRFSKPMSVMAISGIDPGKTTRFTWLL